MILGIMGIGSQELILIVFAALLLFGGKKIPEMMRGLGNGIREFKRGQQEEPQRENTPQQEEVPQEKDAANK